MNNSVYTADRPAEAADQRPVAVPRAVSMQDYRAITEARREFLDFLLARTEHRA